MSRNVNDVGILEESHNVSYGVDVADMSEELVTEALSLACAADESGDIDKFE